jgi:hypothetical protein
MKNWNETIQSLAPKDGDDVLTLKIKGGKGLLLQKDIEVNKERQLQMVANQTRIDDILDHHKIYKIIEDLEYELGLVMELIGIRVTELQKQKTCTQ